MKKVLFIICMCLTVALPSMAELTAGGEYYIWLNIYEKLLGSNETGDGPALSAYGVKSDGYVFVAEASGKDGYVLLKQKSSGKYLAASSANAWSVLFEDKSTDDRFCWKADEGLYTYIVNKKTGGYLGIDGANKGSTYVSVFYNKPKGSHSQYSIIPTTGASWGEARKNYQSQPYTNAQGVKEIDYCILDGKEVSSNDAVDLHITANEKPMTNSKVDLGSERTWLVFDNIVPSEVISSYLKYVTINGEKAKNNTNCRVAIYLNGAVVIPKPEKVMTCTGTAGEFTLAVGNHKDLKEQSNTMVSFTLRRGHMATLATSKEGQGYSRVYVADHADLKVTLPKALTKRVTSVNIKQWQYLSKKGWADTKGASKGPQLRASWYWSWSAGYNSTTDMEYVPCKQHRYWPSTDEVNSKTATASLSLNEPEHSEQHTSDKCSCGGTIDAWTAYTYNDGFLASGGRIGSPQPTDLSYLTTFCKHVDDMASRCDFTVTHAYWNISGRSETAYADWFVGQCKSVYNNTGRPIWLTEMEMGSSWGEKIGSYDENRKYLQVLLQKMEECDYIERYAIYSFDFWKANMFYDDGGITPAGQVYRDHRSTFAYHAAYTKEPAWWVPNVKKPTLEYDIDMDKGTVSFILGNTNGDVTETLVLERKPVGGEWKQIASVDDRSKLEQSKITITLPLADIDRMSDTFRLSMTTLYGGSEISDEVTMGYIHNPTIVTTSKDEVPEWTCQRSATNGFTKAASGDTFFEVWNSTSDNIAFDYYQDLKALPKGVYQLSAVCFNSTNSVEGATVNGNVGLYALADGVEYFAPVTIDSEIDYNRQTVIKRILVKNGTMRIGIKNQGPMTARWAGADNFALEYLGTETEVLKEGTAAFLEAVIQERDQQLIKLFADATDDMKDASVLIRNADCMRNDNYAWTVENLATDKGKAWDGDASNNYWNKWNSGSLTSSMTQTIDYLPAGDYTLGAMLRCTSGQVITLKATHISGDKEKSYEAQLTGTGETVPAGSKYQNGWQQLSLPAFTAASGDRLVISASIAAEVTTWWSADHFTLLWAAPPVVDGISTPMAQPQKDGTEVLYDLLGRRLTSPVKGVYVKNGKKYVK